MLAVVIGALGAVLVNFKEYKRRIGVNVRLEVMGLSAGTGKLCIFGHLGLVFIWSCFVSCLLLLLYYVICAPVLTEGTEVIQKTALLGTAKILRKVLSL